MNAISRHLLSGPGRKLMMCFVSTGLIATPVIARAGTVTMSVNYYTISNSNPDVNQSIDGRYTDEVGPTLGPDGLPVLNTGVGCTAPCYTGQTINDVNGAGELTYWTPSGTVAYTSSSTVTLPYDNASLFPPNGSGPNDSNGFQSATFSSILDVPTSEAIDFSIAADDDAFVYLNGQLVCDLGGITAAGSPAPCDTAVMPAGFYNLQVFYADLHTTQAVLDFSVDNGNITGAPAPEPPSILLLATAVLGLGALQMRRYARR